MRGEGKKTGMEGKEMEKGGRLKGGSRENGREGKVGKMGMGTRHRPYTQSLNPPLILTSEPTTCRPM